MLSMKEAIENYVEGCVGKVDCPAYKLFMKAILAGMMIAFGAAGSSVAAHDIFRKPETMKMEPCRLKTRENKRRRS